MKNLLFVFIVMMNISVYAQNYTPLLDNKNEWNVISCYMGDCFKDVYYTDGDTIVNNQNHKVLDGYHYISRTFLLRENLPEKKVYLTTTIEGDIREYLLYDFSLNENDTVHLQNPITPFPTDGGYFRLDSIRNNPITENTTGKFFYFSPTETNTQSQNYYPVWVEGLGSLSIINAPGGHPDYDGVGKVSCFFKNQNIFYFDDEMTNECQSIMAIQAAETQNRDFQFAINSHLKGILKTNHLVDKLEVFDLSGRKLKSKIFSKNAIYEIDLSDLTNGVYFLLIHEKNELNKISFILK